MKPQVLRLPLKESKEITAILQNDPITNLVTKEFPSAFLVGGYIRDLLLGKTSNDRDYVVTGRPDYEKIKKISEELGGSFFILKNLVRFVFNGQEIDITFTDEPIEIDLGKRDFTINSLAWSSEHGIVDLYGGLRDIKRRVIRLISRENISSDPVRIFRAYRLAAETNCSIDPHTRKVLSELRVMLKITARERLTSELIKLLNLGRPDRSIRIAIDDKILQLILGVNDDDILNNFKLYKKLSVFYRKNQSHLPEISFSQGINGLGFLRLVCLSYKRRKWLIKLSKKNERLLKAFHRMLRVWSPEILRDKKRLFELYYNVKEFPEGPSFLLSSRRLLKETKRFKDVLKNPIIRGLDIVKGDDIPSRHIGILLRRLWALQFAGKIKTKEDALRELQRLKRRLR